MSADAVVASALLGLLGAAAYVTYFTGLRIGPISIVSGTVGAYGGLTVVLSVILRGESLTATQIIGVVIATVGVILTAVAFTADLRGTRFAGPGVAFAIAALFLFALMAITTDVAVERADVLQVLLISRLVTAGAAAIVLAILFTRRRRAANKPRPSAPPRRIDARVAGAIILAGTLDIVGLASFTIGLETAPTWMVGLASSVAPAVTIVVAVTFLGERLRPIQWLGLAGVAVGMIAIALP
jgi:drug/metabolite transporter (DMT)-like permease